MRLSPPSFLRLPALAALLCATLSAWSGCSSAGVSEDEGTLTPKSGKAGKGGKGGSAGKGGSSGKGGSAGKGDGGTSTSSAGAGGGVSLAGGSAGGAAAGAGGAGPAAGSAGAGTGNTGGVCQVGGSPGSATGGNGATGAEVCNNGLDDDGDGSVDEGCACSLGATQDCYPGNPAQVGKGICKKGKQTCKGGGEFTGWGACEGAVLPAAEVCEGSGDENCDGVVDDGCGCCPGAEIECGAAVGACQPGKRVCQPSGVFGPCEGGVEPGTEICDNGVDDDCDGQVDEGCELIVSGQIFINGDCLCSIPCPAVAPYPVGCNIIMDGGDPKGCIAVNKLGQVYFQEGDQCGAGNVQGTLICSSKPGQGLNAQNCPINKPAPLYPASPSLCPYEGGFFDPGPDPCRDF